ncbi:MAG: FHA domain-containing protein [Spirochaetales bacterium]|nr:FHA domain-containing protein [Spirochaetales bacterium]
MKDFTVISRKTPKTKRPEDKKVYSLSSSIRKTPVALNKTKKFTLGKLSKNNLVIREGTVSDIHASIRWDKSSFRIKDEKSTNGTYVNNKRITKVTPLKDGDKIKIGKIVITFSVSKIRVKKEDPKKKKKPTAKKTAKKTARKPVKKTVKKSIKAKSVKKTAKKTVKKKAVKKPVKKSSAKKKKPAAKKKASRRVKSRTIF